MKIKAVAPLEGRRLHITWANGSEADVDLSEHLMHRVFDKVRNSDEIFRAVEIEEYGWAICWPGAQEAAVPSTVLEHLAWPKQ